jgi:hypothetical protein
MEGMGVPTISGMGERALIRWLGEPCTIPGSTRESRKPREYRQLQDLISGENDYELGVSCSEIATAPSRWAGEEDDKVDEEQGRVRGCEYDPLAYISPPGRLGTDIYSEQWILNPLQGNHAGDYWYYSKGELR